MCAVHGRALKGPGQSGPSSEILRFIPIIDEKGEVFLELMRIDRPDQAGVGAPRASLRKEGSTDNAGALRNAFEDFARQSLLMGAARQVTD